ELERGVHRAGARAPHSAGTGVDLLDHLVPVHRPLGQQRQDRGADIAAPAALPAAAVVAVVPRALERKLAPPAEPEAAHALVVHLSEVPHLVLPVLSLIR